MVARAALAVVAVHVADDSLQPQPGTAATDHLLSGLVPLAVLVLAAWAYPRLRVGARASIALVLGLFGIVVGIEAAYYATTDAGLSGDDYTGLLVAGVVLVAVGVTLWQSRRRDDSRRRRYLRRSAIAVGAVAVLFLLIVPFYASYVFTHGAADSCPIPSSALLRGRRVHHQRRARAPGWYIPSRNGAAVIAFPAARARRHAMLARHGYGVLLFDRRGEGESEETRTPSAGAARRTSTPPSRTSAPGSDVDPDRIGGIGLSVGAR